MCSLNKLSENLLVSVKKEESYTLLLEQLSIYPKELLEKELLSDTYKKAFWINIYNAFFQILRNFHNLTQPKIYTLKEMKVAGQKISLDDIEHGILRRFRFKYSLGYFPDPFVSRLIKKWSVSAIDFRIHFALNCGAKSCPPIAFFSVDKLDEQLNLAGISFIQNETNIDEQMKKIQVSRLFLWFLNDFGGIWEPKKLCPSIFPGTSSIINSVIINIHGKRF